MSSTSAEISALSTITTIDLYKRFINKSKNDKNDVTFGDAEATILHEMIHSLGFPAKCSTNNKFFHVNDNKNDIMHKQSGKIYLDFNNDDYYNHGIDNCPDLKDSKFLQ